METISKFVWHVPDLKQTREGLPKCRFLHLASNLPIFYNLLIFFVMKVNDFTTLIFLV